MPDNNRQIAKNTIFLYFRKIITLAIALFSSRVLLQTLGIDDFGLYGLVGSIVILFSSLRGLFASSIQRFLNTEKDSSPFILSRIFSMGVTIHIGIALLFFIAVEIAGLIMIPNLNFSPEKVSVAYWVLQFSLLSAIVSILTVPYDALMMAKERFDAFAGLSMLDSVLRLVIIYLLTTTTFNRVIFYSILLFLVALLMRLLSAIYCKKQFPEIARYRVIKDKELLKEMTRFAGWNFFGNLGYSLTNQGLDFVLNIFGGVVANAARTIAYQVNNNMRSFVVDIAAAFNPQSMMSYRDNKARFYNLQFFASKSSSAIFLIFVFPIYLFTAPVLELWLGECPEYAVSFIRGIILYSIVRNWHGPVDIAFKSANRMMHYQICEISIMILNLPVAWLILHLGAPLYSIFVMMAVIEIVNLGAILIIARRQLNFPAANFLRKVVVPTLAAIALMGGTFLVADHYHFTSHNIGQLIIYCISAATAALIVDILVIFNRDERARIIGMLKRDK